MIKSELVQKLAERNPHLYQNDVDKIVSSILDLITSALSQGHRVELRGFGAFSVRQRELRMGRNPRTGAEVLVPQKHVPFFKTGKELRDRLNGEPPARYIRKRAFCLVSRRTGLFSSSQHSVFRMCRTPGKFYAPFDSRASSSYFICGWGCGC